MGTMTAGLYVPYGWVGYTSPDFASITGTTPIGSISDEVTDLGVVSVMGDLGEGPILALSSPTSLAGQLTLDGVPYLLTYFLSENGYDYYTIDGFGGFFNSQSYEWSLISSSTYTLSVDPGSFSLTGGSATFRNNRILSADGGSFTLSGGAATFTKAKGFDAEPGVFALVGGTAVFSANRYLPAATGSFVLTGGAVTFRKGQTLYPETGMFALTGGEATFRYNFLSAASGLFTLTGGTANFERSWIMVPDGFPADWVGSVDDIPAGWASIADPQPSQWVLGG